MGFGLTCHVAYVHTFGFVTDFAISFTFKLKVKKKEFTKPSAE